MKDDPLVRTAAFIGEAFHISPLQVLDVDVTDWYIQLAAFQVLQEAAEKRASEMKK